MNERWSVVVTGNAYQIMDNGQPAILFEDTTGDMDVVANWIVERLNHLDEVEQQLKDAQDILREWGNTW